METELIGLVEQWCIFYFNVFGIELMPSQIPVVPIFGRLIVVPRGLAYGELVRVSHTLFPREFVMPDGMETQLNTLPRRIPHSHYAIATETGPASSVGEVEFPGVSGLTPMECILDFMERAFRKEVFSEVALCTGARSSYGNRLIAVGANSRKGWLNAYWASGQIDPKSKILVPRVV